MLAVRECETIRLVLSVIRRRSIWLMMILLDTVLMVFSFFAGFLLSLWFPGHLIFRKEELVQSLFSCEERSVSSLEGKTVRGSSMEPLFFPGETIRVAWGWYKCHDPKRNDVILARHAGNDVPLLKRVRGIPGDTFSVRLLEGGEGEVWINGERLANSQGVFYHFSPDRAVLWQSYEAQFRGVVPADAFFLLGETETGSLDSSRFGFVSRRDILGRVETR